MKRSHVLGLVLVVVLTGIGVLVKNISWKEITVPMPLQGEAATNPSYAAQRLVRELGARAERRYSLGVLPPASAVIVLYDWNWGVIEQRRQQLERWVEAGGRLVIDSSLLGGEQALADWSGLALPEPEEDDEDEATEAADSEQPAPETPEPTSQDDDALERALAQRMQAFAGECRELTAALPRIGTRNVYTVCSDEPARSVISAQAPSWALLDDEQIQVARVAIGRGSVTLLASQPFGNRMLFFGDHGLLFAAVTQLRSGDAVYFISDGDSPSLLALVWKYGAPVVVLCLLALALWLWRGALRFGPAAQVTETAQRSLAEQIRGTGRFVVRAGAGRALHAAVARALHEVAIRHIPRYSTLPLEARTAAMARITGIDANALAQALEPATERGVGELRAAISLLESARRTLLRDR